MASDDEVAELIDRTMSEAAGEAPNKKRRIVRGGRKPPIAEAASPSDDDDDDEPNGESNGGSNGHDKGMTLDELDVSQLLSKDLPKATENIKTLGGMIAKYNVGESPDFKLQVWRTWPKTFPGGVKADGFYDTWDQPLSEELIQSEYGGGNYRIVVVGPHPNRPNIPKHYDSIAINLAGDPKSSRMPRANAVAAPPPAADSAPSPFMMAPAENAKLSETAMKLAVDMADKERSERHRLEERGASQLASAHTMHQPAIEAERRRADDLIKAANDRSADNQRSLEIRLAEEREERRKLMERLEQMENGPRQSMGDELGKIMPFLQQKSNGDEGKTAERMMDNVLSKHSAEVEAMRAQYQSMIENINRQHTESVGLMRTSTTAEMASVREANQREVQAERDAGRRREERVEDQLKMEREERRRDQDRHREILEERERAWKDRLEVQTQATNQNWESRHQSVVGNYENKSLWQQQEIDRLKAEMTDMKMKMTDNSDPIAIVHKAKEIKEAIGIPEHSGGSGGGGIGMGAPEDWKNVMAEGLTERAPQIFQMLGGLLSGQPQQQQQQPQVGQIIQTPKGEMVIVQGPNGQLGMTPKAALDAQQRRGALPPGQQRRQVMPDADDVMSQGGRRRKKKIAAVQNFADMDVPGAPPMSSKKRRPPWEGGGDYEDEGETMLPQQQEPPRQQRTSRPQQQAPQERPPQRVSRQMDGQERQALNVVAKLVHDSVMHADEPEEFADRVLKEWNPDMLKKMVGGYSADDIAKGILETAPQSAGATPEGQKFVRKAFQRIEDALS